MSADAITWKMCAIWSLKKSFYHLTWKFYKIQLNKLNEMKTFSLKKKTKFFLYFIAFCSVFSFFLLKARWRNETKMNETKEKKERSWKLQENSTENKKNYLNGMFETRRRIKKLQHLVIQIITLWSVSLLSWSWCFS